MLGSINGQVWRAKVYLRILKQTGYKVPLPPILNSISTGNQFYDFVLKRQNVLFNQAENW